MVLGVNVGINVRVGLGVRVTVSVAVGRVGVRVGVSDAVGVGAVEVGKGPRSESAVRARAVLVLFASFRASASRGERRKPTAYTSVSRPIHRILKIKICKAIRFSFRFIFTFAVLLSFTWLTQTVERAIV